MALADMKESLRALYLLESDDHDSVLELAGRIPAARMGGGSRSDNGTSPEQLPAAG